MRTYQKGISLIVLVITVIVLSILAATVIISLNNTNIIEQTSDTVLKSDMSNYKELYSFYLADRLMEDETFDSTTLNVTSDDAEFAKIFGNNVSSKYEKNLEIIAGRLVYKTNNAEQVGALKELNMSVTVIPSNMQIGDLVEYTPTASATGTYSGATYLRDTDIKSSTYNTYIEKTTNYTPGNMTWVYLGQDEKGNVLLTSQEATSFTMTIAGQDGWVTGPGRMDTLCNTLYGNSTYGEARNMKIEDVNRVLGYDGPKGTYWINSISITTDNSMTFGEIEIKEGVSLYFRGKPRLSETAFKDYVSNNYEYYGTEYTASTTDEYNLIFNVPTYWLSSTSATFYGNGIKHAGFNMRMVDGGEVTAGLLFNSICDEYAPSYALRPVIVLKSNIQFGEKNSDGEWKLVEM